MSVRLSLPLSLALTVVVGVAAPVVALPVAGAQPFQLAQNAAAVQAMSQWTGLMDAADKAVADKAPIDEMLKALEAPEQWLENKMLELRSHPQYRQALDRQLAQRLTRIKLYTNIGFLYAKSAAEKRDSSLLNQQGGAFARIQQATDTLSSYARYKGEADAGYRKMSDYVAQIKTQVDSVGKQLGSTPGAGGPPESTTAIDNGTRTYFAQWWEKLNAVDQAVAKKDRSAEGLLRAAVEHQKGWNNWLKRHSAYETVLARQNAMTAKLATGKADGFIDEAMTMARKAFGEKNTNFFGPEAGPAQRLGWARKELEAYIKLNGEADPAVAPLQKRIDEATQQIEQWGAQLKAERLAKRTMPADVYAGGDKAALKAQILAYWKQKYPQDKVLGVRFFQNFWKRETSWNSNATSIYKSDYSWLPVKVIVQDSKDIAKLYPVFANKQHQEGNRIIVSGDHSGGMYTVDEMLMKNVKF